MNTRNLPIDLCLLSIWCYTMIQVKKGKNSVRHHCMISLTWNKKAKHMETEKMVVFQGLGHEGIWGRCWSKCTDFHLKSYKRSKFWGPTVKHDEHRWRYRTIYLKVKHGDLKCFHHIKKWQVWEVMDWLMLCW